MIYYKTSEEIEKIRRSCLLVSQTLAEVAKAIRPGCTGKSLDELAESFIRDHNALPGFKGYGGFPATLCISVNDQVVHGIPSTQELKDGDIVSVDCGVKMNGYYGDAAYTFALGEVSEDTMQLLRVTNESLYEGIEAAKVGGRLGDIGFAVQEYCERLHGYGVVRDLVGHGVGRNLHEAPEVPNYGNKNKGLVLREGLVIAIEPMVNRGAKEVGKHKDGWTIRTVDGTPSAHYEHTIAIRKNGPDILSDHKIIEEAIKNNQEIKEISPKSAIFALRN
jgi:methionyl aminopeptidase